MKKSCKHKKQAEVNAILLQSLSELQRQGPLQINHGHEGKNNGAYRTRYPSRRRSNRSDTIRDGRLLDTTNRIRDRHMYYSSFGSDRHHDHHRYYPYKRSDMVYFLDEFKKVKPPSFDGEMKKSQDGEAWLLGMKKFFRLHDYSENMKEKIVTFSVKGKADIWWEHVNNVKDIHEDDLTWHAFKRLFKKKYLSERYYDDRAKEFYEFPMGSMTNEEYTSTLLELLRYVPYLREEKAKV